jgi:RecB family endonuclease NucS
MIIDESKVNLLEKDIEEYIFCNPNVILTAWGHIDKWIKRQFQVPSGIVDLLGVTQGGALAVVEIKNVAIDANALTQVCRYAYDLERVVSWLKTYHENHENDFPEIIKIVVGRSIETRTMREAEALNVNVYCFEVKLELSADRTYWTSEFERNRESQYEELSNDKSILSVIEEYDQEVSSYTEDGKQLGDGESSFDAESFFK